MTTPFNIKRLIREWKMYEEDIKEYTDLGLHLKFNEENIKHIKAMIIGPEGTPYQGCFFFINFEFTANYPFTPPKATFMNQYKHIRFNPNLYSCGKVCLSILGTWAGPGWTSMMNTKSILLSIQSLLLEHPIRQEPSYELIKSDDPKNVNYTILVGWYVLKLAILEVLHKSLSGFEEFHEVMIEHFIKNHKMYSDLIDNYKQYDGQTFTSNYGNMSDTINVVSLLERFDKLSDTYLPK
jgi:ubiquitin-protein ligase